MALLLSPDIFLGTLHRMEDLSSWTEWAQWILQEEPFPRPGVDPIAFVVSGAVKQEALRRRVPYCSLAATVPSFMRKRYPRQKMPLGSIHSREAYLHMWFFVTRKLGYSDDQFRGMRIHLVPEVTE